MTKQLTVQPKNRPMSVQFRRGGRRSIKKLRDLSWDPITELVNNYRRVEAEILRQEAIRDGKVVEMTANGKIRSYYAPTHHALYDKLIKIGEALLRYGYGRVPEIEKESEKPAQPFVVNLTQQGDTFVINDIEEDEDFEEEDD
jgi:hypothetical protein